MDSIDILSISLSALALTVSIITAYQQFSLAKSQNIKSYFEIKLQRILQEGLEPIDISTTSKPPKYIKEVNKINVPNYIWETMINMTDQDDYNFDLKKYNSGDKMERDYFEKRSYYGDLLFLTAFTLKLSPLYFYYQRIVEFINEIDNSKLTKDDKYYLKMRIKDEILLAYIATLQIEGRFIREVKIPLPYHINSNAEETIFCALNDTDYNYFYKTSFVNLTTI
jgi:hypothetical protein